MNRTENLSPSYLFKAVSSEFSSGIWELIHFVVPETDEAVTAVIVMCLSPLVSPVHRHRTKKPECENKAKPRRKSPPKPEQQDEKKKSKTENAG
jgi:hypothetical protein